jgi:hypothetical protein
VAAASAAVACLIVITARSQLGYAQPGRARRASRQHPRAAARLARPAVPLAQPRVSPTRRPTRQNHRFGFADQQPWCAKKRTAPGGIASLDRPKTPNDGPFLPLNSRQPAMFTSIVQLLGTAATAYGVLAALSVLT